MQQVHNQKKKTHVPKTERPEGFDKVKGMEVLSFDHVELTKNKTGKNTFMEVGTLRVMFFPEFDRFILDLGDWEYALLKRLPVTSSSRTDQESRTYTFPTYSGFYALKISKIIHPEALQNFETILSHASRFSYFGEEATMGRNELSPDVGLMERSEEDKNTVPTKRSSLSGKSTEEAEQLSLHGKEKIKRSFAKFMDKLTGSHAKKVAESNLFLTQVMNFEDMRNMNAEYAPIINFGRKEIELAIMKSKDIASVMHFGASPNTVQLINRETLAETIAKEGSNVQVHQQESIMTESIELLPYGNTTVTKEEMALLKEIERERELQVEERRLQEEHRRNEQTYLDKEREIRDSLNLIQDEKRIYAVNKTEEKFRVEIEKKDDIILEQARIRDQDLLAWEQREKELMSELRARLDELKAKEKMSEEEHKEFVRKEQQLLEISRRVDAQKREAELRTEEITKEATIKNEELTRREQMTAEEYARLQEKERQLEMETQKRIDELKSKAELSEKERLELIEQQDAMAKIMALKEAERLQIQKEQQILYEDSVRILEELRQREKMTEAERKSLESKEADLEMELQRILADFRAREFLTEEQQRELQEREKELKRIAVLREAERVDFVKRQIELQAEAERREAELRARAQLTEAEREELENMKLRLQKQNVIKEIELRDILKRRNELFEEAERREAEINRRLNLKEAEYKELQFREEELEKEIQARLAELKFKEELTEYERKELEERERELSKLRETRTLEIKARQIQADKLKEHEAELLKQNQALIQGHREMHEEIKELKNELEKPVETIVRETVVEKKEVFGDVTQV